jgi:hypothetical protein
MLHDTQVTCGVVQHEDHLCSSSIMTLRGLETDSFATYRDPPSSCSAGPIGDDLVRYYPTLACSRTPFPRCQQRWSSMISWII